MPGFPKPGIHGTVNIMAGIQAGVVAAADINSQPDYSGGLMDSPAKWSLFWFVASTVYLAGLYYGMIRIRSGEL